MAETTRDGDAGGTTVDAIVVPRSDYPAVYRVGRCVALEIEAATGRVVVTVGSGRVKLAYVVESHAERIASSLRASNRHTGRILEVSATPEKTILHLYLDPPSR